MFMEQVLLSFIWVGKKVSGTVLSWRVDFIRSMRFLPAMSCGSSIVCLSEPSVGLQLYD